MADRSLKGTKAGGEEKKKVRNKERIIRMLWTVILLLLMAMAATMTGSLAEDVALIPTPAPIRPTEPNRPELTSGDPYDTQTPEPTRTPLALPESPTPKPTPTPLPLPDSPEPPPPVRTSRPTPTPTPIPPTVVDHVNQPEAWAGFELDAEKDVLDIWFPDIRDADEAILRYQGQTWLIDCGDERGATRAIPLIQSLGIREIEMLFNTHPHHDHLNGLAITDDTAKVKELLYCFPSDSTNHMIRALQIAEERGIRVKEYRDGDVFAMGDGQVTLTFLQNRSEKLDMNNRSAQTMVRYGDRSMFFMADMEKPGQVELLEQVGAKALKTDIFKYPHHGKNAMYDPFFNALGAELTVVTCFRGREDSGQIWLNAKRFPSAYTSKADVYLHLATDGIRWLCEYVPRNQVR